MSRLDEMQVVRMTDDELLRTTYGTIATVEDGLLSDRLYWLVTEAMERWAPDVERRYEITYQHENNPGNPDMAEAEIDGHIEAMERRARLRAKFGDFYENGLREDA